MTTPPGNPPPGWYPNPAGGGGYRYWDGINWTEEAPPSAPAGVPSAPFQRPAVSAPPVKAGVSKGAKIGLGVGGAVVALVAIAAIGSSDESGDKSKVASSPSSRVASAPAPTRTPQAAPPAPVAPPPKATKEVAPPGSAVRDGKFEFEVLGVGRSATKDGLFSPETAKGEYFSVTLRVTNIGDKAQTFFASNQYLMIGDKKYDASSSLSDDSWREELNPGLSIDATVVFDIPPTEMPTAIQVHDSLFSGGALLGLPTAG